MGRRRQAAAEEVAAARAELSLRRERVFAIARGVDLYLSPTLGSPILRSLPRNPTCVSRWVADTHSISLLGWPAMTISDLQLAGPDTATVLAAALAWEAANARTFSGGPL